MKAKIGMKCILCKRSMNFNTAPNMIFDLEKEKLLGLAHSTCTQKAKLDWYASKPIKWDNELPSEQQIIFGCKIAKIMQKLRDFNFESNQFYVRILLYECLWKTIDAKGCLSSKRVQELLDWWINGPNMSPSRVSQIEALLNQLLKE